MADHLIDLKPGSSETPKKEDSKPGPGYQPQGVLLPSPKRANRLKRRHSVKSPQERERRNLSRGFLVFVVVLAVVSGALWFGLWHVPGLAPWPFPTKDAKGNNLAVEISILWILHFVHRNPFNGYD